MDEFEAVKQTIALLQQEVKELEDKLRAKKSVINDLCVTAKIPPAYPDLESGEPVTFNPNSKVGSYSVVTRSDQYYGRPLATCIREILEFRKNRGQGPATVKDIYETLRKGGYAFGTENDLNAMRGLRVSLTKNTSLFHKLPGGEFGLIEWYPKVKRGGSE